jgi:hypothetical protein
MANDFPFFLLGHDRSGTTMLRLILDRGDVAIPPESMFLLDVDSGQPADDVLHAAWNHPRVRLWGLTGEPPALPEGMGADAFRFGQRPFSVACLEGRLAGATRPASIARARPAG